MPRDCIHCFMPCELKLPLESALVGKRMDDCPLTEVPPHGRLIDADKIGLTNFEILLCQTGNPYKNALEMIVEKIENATIIVPPEEGEKKNE